MKRILYIGLGGFCGAVARFMFKNIVILHSVFYLPLNTFITNISGSFVLTFLLSLSMEKLLLSQEAKLGLTTGFLGAFTTFSTFSKESYELLTKGRPVAALLYIFASLFMGLGAAYAGYVCAVRLSRNARKGVIK